MKSNTKTGKGRALRGFMYSKEELEQNRRDAAAIKGFLWGGGIGLVVGVITTLLLGRKAS